MNQDVKWVIPQEDKKSIEELVNELDITEVLAQVLINRGLKTAEEASLFLSPKLEINSLLDAKEVEIAAQRIKKAILNNERILIYGDYDVDGICGVVILLKILKKLGARVLYHIPSRNVDGYGLNERAVRAAYKKNFSLIITVDCGIQDIKEVNLANQLGIDIIITDHHLAGDTLPCAYSIINPKLYDNKFFYDLAGVTSASILAAKLLEEDLTNYIDLITLGTVADVVPLLYANRYLIKYGLEKLKETKLQGLKALIEVAGLKGKNINSEYHIPFILGPRINAAGRVANAAYAVQLLLTDDEVEAKELATMLDKKNRERQEIQDRILTEAKQIIEKEIDLTKYKILVLANYNWPISIVGIVAAKLTEIHNRPCIIISLEEGKEIVRGSCRSIPEFNIFSALNSVSELLIKFGGHKYAAGLEIAVDKIDIFREEINKVASERLTSEMLSFKLIIDKVITFSEITAKLFNELDKLPPYGVGNQKPLFLTNNVLLKDKVVFEDRQKIVVSNNNISYDATLSHSKGIPHNDNLSIVYTLEKMAFTSYEVPHLRVRDIR